MLFLLLRLLSVVQLASASNKEFSFGRLLESNQYLIISQLNCHTTFESRVEDGCPRAVFIPSKDYLSRVNCNFPVRVHLVRDPENKRPPRALYIGQDNHKKTIAFVEDIKEFTIYDYSYQLLYLVNGRQRENYRCTVLWLSNLFPDANDNPVLDKRHFADFPMHDNNRARFGWTEDPYNHVVYYATANGGVTTVYVLPMNRLLSAFQEGAHGEVFYFFDNTNRILMSMTSRVIFTHESEKDHTTVYIRSFANVSETATGVACRFLKDAENVDSLAQFSFVIVRDWDYCRLRDGPSANPSSCAREREQWLLKEGIVTSPVDWWLGVLLMSVIILVTVLISLVFQPLFYKAVSNFSCNKFDI
ncbi:unnamed protein product [Nippostrongylus brasiliensis]|uniref:Envelope glycoprotein D n=1 Tax=Nippostrongylus brasiliensis TaxID=27835 RepID=A0A158QWF0_NIPBR|nr:unnamed protein product [Nippostrongylus brasiliensis]